MKQAIEKAIYYSDSNTYNPVVTFQYSDEKTFKDIVKELSNNIDVIATFGRKDNICYTIFNNLSYKDLLFDKTTLIYLVNRKDIAICLNRETAEENDKQRIAIIKIDAVLSEYSPNSIKHYFFYPITFMLGLSLIFLKK